MQAEAVVGLFTAGLLGREEARAMLGWEAEAVTRNEETAPAIEVRTHLPVALAVDELRAWKRARPARKSIWMWEFVPPELGERIEAAGDDVAHVIHHAVEALKALPDGLDENEQRIAEVVMETFDRHRRRVLAALTRGEMPDLTALRRDLRRALMPVFLDIADAEAQRLAETLAQGTDEDLLGDLATWAARYADERAAQMTESTIRAIQRAREAAEDGVVDWMVITERLFGDVRAGLVGITEATQVLSVAAQVHAERLAKQGVETVTRWLTAEDERVCPICRPLDHQPQSRWKERFPDGPPAHPRCRCRLVVEVKK